MVEKEELVKTLLDSCGSSDAACSICCEDYAAGDVLRRLRCGHGFHLVRKLASAVQCCACKWRLHCKDAPSFGSSRSAASQIRRAGIPHFSPRGRECMK